MLPTKDSIPEDTHKMKVEGWRKDIPCKQKPKESWNNYTYVTRCKSTCPMRREVKQHQNVGIWSREGFIAEPYTEMSGLFLEKSPELPKTFGKSLLQER